VLGVHDSTPLASLTPAQMRGIVVGARGFEPPTPAVSRAPDAPQSDQRGTLCRVTIRRSPIVTHRVLRCATMIRQETSRGRMQDARGTPPSRFQTGSLRLRRAPTMCFALR
jgi:hypothetical protein